MNKNDNIEIAKVTRIKRCIDLHNYKFQKTQRNQMYISYSRAKLL